MDMNLQHNIQTSLSISNIVCQFKLNHLKPLEYLERSQSILVVEDKDVLSIDRFHSQYLQFNFSNLSVRGIFLRLQGIYVLSMFSMQR